MERNEILEKDKWRVADIYPSDEAWEQAYEAVKKKLEDFDTAKYQGKLGDKQTLLSYFAEVREISRVGERLYLYAHMCHDQDVRVARYTSAQSKMVSFFYGDPWENRTPVCGVRGRRLDRLTNGPRLGFVP